MWIFFLLSIIIGYLCGCFQTAYIIGRFNNIDIREHGSGNAGTTNTLRTLGTKAALLNFLGDGFKGIAGVFIARYLFAPLIPGVDSQLLCLITGFCTVIGHNYPFFLKFKGGKGIAATAAVTLAFDWRFGLISFLIFTSITIITRYVSLASLVMALAFPINTIIFYPGHWELSIVACMFTILAFIRHQANIKRLMSGTENKLGQKNKDNDGGIT